MYHYRLIILRYDNLGGGGEGEEEGRGGSANGMALDHPLKSGSNGLINESTLLSEMKV